MLSTFLHRTYPQDSDKDHWLREHQTDCSWYSRTWNQHLGRSPIFERRAPGRLDSTGDLVPICPVNQQFCMRHRLQGHGPTQVWGGDAVEEDVGERP